MQPLQGHDLGPDTGVERRRVLLVLADATARAEVASGLRAAGLEVRTSAGDEPLGALVEAVGPDLILMGQSFAEVSGRELTLGLRASGGATPRPVVALLEPVTVRTAIRWLAVGAVDVWGLDEGDRLSERALALLDECQASPLAAAGPAERLHALARRHGISGTLLAYPDTPFEGRAVFRSGHLLEAALGEVRGEWALAQLLELDDAPLDWVEVAGEPAEAPPLPTPGRPTRVLVVEDVATLAHLVRKTLEHAGHVVDVVSDGRAGLQAALARSHDIVVLDLNLPVLDGWGVMRALREDLAARECAVVVLSAHDDQVDALKAARAGARAWLTKSGHSRELLSAVATLARPRAVAFSSLRAGWATPLDLRSLGPVWVLRTLAELDHTGVLAAHDELARIEVHLDGAQLAQAVAQVGSLRLTGAAALGVLLSCRGAGVFTPGQVEAGPGAPWLYDVLQEACLAAAAEARRAQERASANPQGLTRHRELAALFAQMASPLELAVLDAVPRSPSIQALATRLGAEEGQVRSALVELLRRGVLVAGSDGQARSGP